MNLWPFGSWSTSLPLYHQSCFTRSVPSWYSISIAVEDYSNDGTVWVELMDIGKIFIQQYLMKKSKLKEKKHFSAFLASSFIDTNPQTILKCLILITSPIHFGYTCFNHLLQQNKGKMYGGGNQNMRLVEYFNLCRVLLHQKPWRFICWSPSNSQKNESYGAKQHLKGKVRCSIIYCCCCWSYNWVFSIPLLLFLLSKKLFSKYE